MGRNSQMSECIQRWRHWSFYVNLKVILFCIIWRIVSRKFCFLELENITMDILAKFLTLQQLKPQLKTRNVLHTLSQNVLIVHELPVSRIYLNQRQLNFPTEWIFPRPSKTIETLCRSLLKASGPNLLERHTQKLTRPLLSGKRKKIQIISPFYKVLCAAKAAAWPCSLQFLLRPAVFNLDSYGNVLFSSLEMSRLLRRREKDWVSGREGKTAYCLHNNMDIFRRENR